MRSQPTARVTLNDSSVPVSPGWADHIGARGPVVLDVSMHVGLDADDIAAALWIYLDSCPISEVAFDDTYAWEMIADTLVNNGLGSTMTAAREAVASPADSENPALAAWCKGRAAELVSRHATANDRDALALEVAS